MCTRKALLLTLVLAWAVVGPAGCGKGRDTGHVSAPLGELAWMMHTERSPSRQQAVDEIARRATDSAEAADLLVDAMFDSTTSRPWPPARDALIGLGLPGVRALERGLQRDLTTYGDNWVIIHSAGVLAQLGSQGVRSLPVLRAKLRWMDGRQDPAGVVPALREAVRTLTGSYPPEMPATVPYD